MNSKAHPRMIAIVLPLALVAAADPIVIPPRAERGRADADCRAQEPGPAFRVDVAGLKDRSGTLILELYPATEDDFLQSDKVLIAAGKPFRRVPVAVPATGPVRLCIRAPGPGRYALSLLHDRDGNGKFGFFRDGIAFANNPRLGTKKPAVASATIAVDHGVQTIRMVMNYRRGLGMAPLPVTTADAR